MFKWVMAISGEWRDMSYIDYKQFSWRRVRLDELNTMIDQMAHILPRMDYSGRTPKESKWVVELRNAATKAEPICLSPLWREIENVMDAIGLHMMTVKSKSGVTTTFKL